MDEKSIFLTALETSDADERNSYLDGACGEDSEMRRRVETLLHTYDDAGSFLEHPPEDVELAHTVIGSGDTADKDHPGSSTGDRTLLQGVSDEINLDFLAHSATEDSLGLIGHYEVNSVIGRGGMGVVLSAHDPKLSRTVAVKVLAPEYSANQTARDRFRREAKAAAAVSHPHVITTYSVDGEHHPPYLVMEYIDGQSLREKIERCGALELKEILRIGSQIAAGLAAAHKQGLMHRDIKPANILLENGVERVKITDFGLARTVDDVGVTRTGEVAGTPQFMSPEQASGDAIDLRSDLFSLGSVLYTMCTGQAPFRGDTTYAVIRRVVDEAPRSISEVRPEVPDWLRDIIKKLLSKQPEDRFQTAGEVAELLEQHLAHIQHPASAPKPAPIRKPSSAPTPSKKIPPAIDHRPDPSAQSRRLVLLVAAVAAFVFLPCLLLMLTEGAGITNFSGLVSSGDRTGKLIVEVYDPTVTVSISGEGQSIASAGYQEHDLQPGRYTVVASSTTGGGLSTHNEIVWIRRGEVTTVTTQWSSIQVAETEPPEVVNAPSLADIPHQSFIGWGAAWSPDGTRIVLQTSPEVSAHPAGMLQTVQLETGQIRPLVRHGKDPAWSPRADGPIAYVLHGDGREDVWFIDPDGQNNRSVTEGGFPSWSSDGSTLIYHHNPSHTLRSLNIDDPAATPVTLMECRHLYPAISPDGARCAVRDSENLNIFNIDSGDQVGTFSLPGMRGLLACWSPDGNHLIYGGYGAPSDGPMTLLDIASGEATPLIQEPLTMPRLSPDGTRLVADDRTDGTVVLLNLTDLLSSTDAAVLANQNQRLTEERLKLLVSEAASIPNDEWISLAGDVRGPGAAAVSGMPLSLVLLTLDPMAIARDQPDVQQDFWYLTDQMPKPSEIASAMSISMPSGYVSCIQPVYVTNVEINIEDDMARGFIGFSAPKMYVGRVEFVAQLVDGAWTIKELTLPNYGISLGLQHDGVWENINAGASETDEVTTEPVAKSRFFNQMSNLSRFIDCCGASTTISVTKGEPSSETGNTAAGLHHQAQLVSDVLGPPERMNEYMGGIERELRYFARQDDAQIDAIATERDTEDQIARLTFDYTTEETAHGEVEIQLKPAETPDIAEPGKRSYTLTIRIEEWVRIPEVSPDGLIRSVTSSEEVGIPPAPPEAVRE